jgi:hypothetical protein
MNICFEDPAGSFYRCGLFDFTGEPAGGRRNNFNGYTYKQVIIHANI